MKGKIGYVIISERFKVYTDMSKAAFVYSNLIEAVRLEKGILVESVIAIPGTVILSLFHFIH